MHDFTSYIGIIGGGISGLTLGCTLRKNGRWTVEEIDAMFSGTLGMDMDNPAPPQAPKE